MKFIPLLFFIVLCVEAFRLRQRPRRNGKGKRPPLRVRYWRRGFCHRHGHKPYCNSPTNPLGYSYNSGPIYLKPRRGTYLKAHSRGKVGWTRARRAHAEWKVVPLGNGKVALQSRWGKYLAAKPNGQLTQVSRLGKWNRWTPKKVNGKTAFKGKNGARLRAGLRGMLSPFNPVTLLANWKPWEIFPRFRR